VKKAVFNIFFTIDKNYKQHFTVAVTSLLENNQDMNLNIFVIHDMQDISVMDIAIDFIRDTYGVTFNFINVDHVDFSRFRTSYHYSKSVYFRLLIPDIIPESVESGLFLDADLIVTGSLKPLANIDVSQQYIFAVSEVDIKTNVSRLNKMGFPNESYFNAGVLLINLKKWRQERLTERFISLANQYMHQLEWWDQDILNMHFTNNWVSLDKKYNAIYLLEKLSSLPVIVHYASVNKPWKYVDLHPYKYLYWQYLKLTPFKKSRPEDFTIRNFILKNGRIVKKALRKRGLIK
jgi:lipopolysaccharide biosynthesis glycosyltransferase